MTQNHDCSQELRKVALAVTPGRIAAMQLFEQNDKPIDAFSVVENLSKDGVDRVTAFRILNTFVDRGLIRKIELREGKSRYELTTRGDHHHFICSLCGDITDIGKDIGMHDFIKKTEKKFGFQVTDHSLELFGICASCQRKESN